jgi:hypothetical protein
MRSHKSLQQIHQEKDALQREYDALNHKLKDKTRVENEYKLARKGVLESIEENKNRIKGVQQEVHAFLCFKYLIPLLSPHSLSPPCDLDR